MAQVDYKAILDEAWQQHLAPRTEDAPTVISTFAGAGGSSLGYSMAGFRELLAVEWDDNAVATFKLNFPDVPVYHGDIAKLSIEECLQLAGIKPGELDVLDGSPPCQGFSTAGKRQLDDPRNQLAMEFVRLLRGLRPKAFVMENVSGLVKGKMKLVFAEIMRELKASGYDVKCRLMNAMYFQVPQSRERLIWIGLREDLEIKPEHPKGQSNLILIRQAWAGIEDDKGDALTGPALMIAPYVPPGDNNGGGKYSLPIRGTHAGFGFSRLHWNKPSCCLPKESILSSSPIVHPEKHERISIHQAQRIGAYPDSFEFIGDFKDRWACIGNSVPPLFMRAIALHVKELLEQAELTKLTNGHGI